MTEPDAVLVELAKLAAQAPPDELSRKLTAAGRARLVPAKVHPAWSLAVALSVLTYLGWAVHFTSQLF